MTTIRPFGRVDRELDVRPAGLDADLADDQPRGVAHPLVFLVAERQDRRHGDAVAGVHAHRIDVLDRADDDEVVGDVAHHLELEFLPADDRFLDEHLVHRAQLEPALGELAELLDVVGDAAADAAERERRPDDQREAERAREIDRLRQACAPGRSAARRGRSTRIASLNSWRSSAILIASIDAPISLTLYFSRTPAFGEIDREVERGLAADGRQDRVGPLARDDRLEEVHRERLDVGAVGQLRVGHDRRRVAVDEHDLEPLGAQRLAGLRARVVELARLADDDRAGADHEHAFQVGSSRHFAGGWGSGCRPGAGRCQPPASSLEPEPSPASPQSAR